MLASYPIIMGPIVGCAILYMERGVDTGTGMDGSRLNPLGPTAVDIGTDLIALYDPGAVRFRGVLPSVSTVPVHVSGTYLSATRTAFSGTRTQLSYTRTAIALFGVAMGALEFMSTAWRFVFSMVFVVLAALHVIQGAQHNKLAYRIASQAILTERTKLAKDGVDVEHMPTDGIIPERQWLTWALWVWVLASFVGMYIYFMVVQIQGLVVSVV